jgi:predicted Zn-dependent protease
MMRMVRQQPLLAFLTASMVLVAVLPIYSKKNLNNPDKIGHRNVAHRSVISCEKESAIGKEYARQFESTVELVQDPVVQRYVTKVAEIVVRNSDLRGSVIVKVLKSPNVDCLSLPGGFIYLKSGLLVSAENEDAVAGAIAHQVGHAAARHWASGGARQMIAQHAMLPSIFVPTGGRFASVSITVACRGFMSLRRTSFPGPASPLIKEAIVEAYLDGMPVAFLKFLRKDELEADYLALQYMYKAGYDPSTYVALLRKLALEQPTSSLPESLQDMPPVSERIEQAEKEIRNILPNAPSPSKPSSEFIVMKSHLQFRPGY